MPDLFPAWFIAWAGSVTLLELLIYALAIAAVLKWGKRWWFALVTAAQAFLAFAATLASIRGLTAFMAATTSTLASQTDTLATQSKSMADQNERIVGIYHETHKNDGSSLKDAGDRTERAVDRLELGMLAIFKRLDAAGIRPTDDEGQIRRDLENTHPPRSNP